MPAAARSPDVIVVGAGAIGLSTASALLRCGVSVTVLDRNAVGPGGASWAGGGILAPLDPADIDPGLIPLLRESLALHPGWCGDVREVGGIDPEFTVSGLSVLSPADRDAWRRLAIDCGLPIEDRGVDLLLPSIGQVRSPRLLRGLAAAVRRLGGTIVEHANVRHLVGEGRVTGVETAGGVQACGAVVLAAGAWSAALDPSTHIVPVKGEMLLFRAPGAIDRIVLRDHMYLIPRRDGGVVAGSTLESAGFDDAPTAAGRRTILDAVRAMAPAMAAAPVEAHWAGLRPAPPGGLPLVGAVPDRPGLFHNCGHHRLGITLAPGSAQRIAALLVR